MSDPYAYFLAELKATRKVRKMTQAQLAMKIKLSRAQYTAIENGRSLVNYAHLYNLSKALGVRWSIGDPSFPLASRYVRT